MQSLSSPYIAVPITEKLVKIRPVVPENALLIGRPQKNKEKLRKNIGKIYSLLGTHARRAKS